jgi:hypothetical protein
MCLEIHNQTTKSEYKSKLSMIDPITKGHLPVTQLISDIILLHPHYQPPLKYSQLVEKDPLVVVPIHLIN